MKKPDNIDMVIGAAALLVIVDTETDSNIGKSLENKGWRKRI